MLAWLALHIPTAAAADCAPYSPVQFTVDLAMVTDALADNDIADARTRLGAIGERLPCLTVVVDPDQYAKFARYVAHTHHLAQDDAGTRRWLLSSLIAAPSLDWNATVFPAAHPLRAVADSVERPAPGDVTQGLHPPDGGGVFLNGQLVLDASAPEGLPYLAQAFDRRGRSVDGWWQEGGRFPEDYLSKRFRDLPRPRWWNPPVR